MSLYVTAVASVKMSHSTFSFDHMWHLVKKYSMAFDGKILIDEFKSHTQAFISILQAQIVLHQNVIVTIIRGLSHFLLFHLNDKSVYLIKCCRNTMFQRRLERQFPLEPPLHVLRSFFSIVFFFHKGHSCNMD